MAGTVASPGTGPCTPALRSGKQHSQSGRSAGPVGPLLHPPSSLVGTRYGLELTFLGVSNRPTRGPKRALLHHGVNFAGNWNSSDPPVRNKPTVRCTRLQRGREGKRTPPRTFHWWPLGVDPALCSALVAFGGTHFRGRAEEAGWWRRGQDGGAFEDSERLGSSPQEG